MSGPALWRDRHLQHHLEESTFSISLPKGGRNLAGDRYGPESRSDTDERLEIMALLSIVARNLANSQKRFVKYEILLRD